MARLVPSSSFPFRLAPLALAVLAQSAAAADDSVTIRAARAEEPAPSVAGFGNGVPLSRAPFQASVFGAEALKDQGVQRLADLTRLDAAVSDAYNAEGYWDYLSVRGFTLDNRFNYRRDGLPINAETWTPLDNKERIEVLKGISGIQAGTSAPGGLANYVVKRPTGRVMSGTLGWRSSNSVLAAVDVGDRFGAERQFGLRINAAAERLDPPLRSAEGQRRLFAVAGDWQLSPDTLIEAEFETSRRRQPSQPGFSLLGNTVPAPVDPRINLNNQPWSQPVVMDATTASLRWTQRLGADWRFIAHGAVQRLKTDDRLAYPFGCYDAATDTYYGDRYCPNGNFDLWDFRSENERRRTDALDLGLHGTARWGGLEHRLSAGVLLTRFTARFQNQVYDYARDVNGNQVQGNIDGTAVTLPAPGVNDANTNRDERSTEFYLRDAIRLSERWDAWVGLRHTRIHRKSVRTDFDPTDLRPTDVTQSFNTPWLALSYRVLPEATVYASWGRGVESAVAPNRPAYTNGGQSFSLQSRQAEIGLKARAAGVDWQVAAFDIVRPATFGGLGCDTGTDDSCTFQFDGDARHRGLEAAAQWRAGAWALTGSAMWLDAERRGSANAAVNGQRPPNVPERTLKLNAGYRVAALPGLQLLAGVVHEGGRTLLPDNGALTIPAWTRLDLGLVYQQRLGDKTLTWRAGVDNATDKRAWRESPYQFDHVYLYPMAPRSWRASVQVDL